MVRPTVRPTVRLGGVVPSAGALLAVMLVGTACSESQSSASQARAVVQRLYSDIENGRGAEACSLLTPAAREEVARTFRLFPTSHKLDCERVLASYSQATAHDAASVRELKSTTFSSVSVIGDHAMVAVNVPHVGLRAAPLTNTRDGWRISQFSISTRQPIGG